jgi:4-hydroxy-2-oxoheptanedioate aldolase
MKNPENLFKKRLAEGVQQLGIWMTIPGNSTAELLATCGYDWMLIDTEHSPIAVNEVLPALQALAAYPAVSPVVRVVQNDTALIKRLLDLGAQSLMIPYVQTADEAAAAVQAMRYGPRGIRGMAGLTRATRFGQIEGYAANASDELCLVVQVETIGALERIEEIAGVDGVDAVFIGPADLAASMGYPGEASHPEVKQAIRDALARLRTIGKPSGILTLDLEFLRECISLGTRFTAIAVDMALLLDAAKERASAFR